MKKHISLILIFICMNCQSTRTGFEPNDFYVTEESGKPYEELRVQAMESSESISKVDKVIENIKPGINKDDLIILVDNNRIHAETVQILLSEGKIKHDIIDVYNKLKNENKRLKDISNKTFNRIILGMRIFGVILFIFGIVLSIKISLQHIWITGVGVGLIILAQIINFINDNWIFIFFSLVGIVLISIAKGQFDLFKSAKELGKERNSYKDIVKDKLGSDTIKDIKTNLKISHNNKVMEKIKRDARKSVVSINKNKPESNIKDIENIEFFDNK